MKRLTTICLVLVAAAFPVAGCSSDDSSTTTTESGTEAVGAWAEKWQPAVDEYVSQASEWDAFSAEPEMNADMTQFLQENSKAAQTTIDTIDDAGAPPDPDLEVVVTTLRTALQDATAAMDTAAACTGACTTEREAVTNALNVVQEASDKATEALTEFE